MPAKRFKSFVLVEIEGEAYNDHSPNGIVHRIKTAIEVGAKKYGPMGWVFKCAHLPEIQFPDSTGVVNERGEPSTETGNSRIETALD